MASAVTWPLFTKRGATEPGHATVAALLSACAGLFLLQWLPGSLAQAALVSCAATCGKNVQSSFVVAVFDRGRRDLGSPIGDQTSALRLRSRALATGPPGKYPRIMWFLEGEADSGTLSESPKQPFGHFVKSIAQRPCS